MIDARRRLCTIGLVSVLGATLLVGCSDRDIERTLGKQTAAAIESTYKVVDDPLLTSYINTMGHILVGHSRRQDIPYQFKVIETDVVNAAAAPWGYIYLTTGLLDFVESEDELWAVTGHEIGHEVKRDSVKAVKENILLSLATVLIGRETRLGGDIAEFGFSLLSLKHSRDDEYQADDHAVAVTYAAGYDPTAHVRFFERLMTEVERNHPSRLETLFLTHPPSKARIARQSKRPEVALTEAERLAHVAAGYARRGRYAEAIERLQKAVELNPDLVSARVLLGECYLARGDREQAKAQFAAALQADSSLMAAHDGLRATEAPSPAIEMTAASPEELSRAQEMVEHAAGDTEKARATAEAVAQKLSTGLAPVAKTMKGSTKLLLTLTERPADLSPVVQRLTADAGLAIAEANETVYCLEHISEVFEEVADRLSRSLDSAQTVNSQTLTADEAAVVARSALQLSRCAGELETLSEQMPHLLKTAQNASRVSRSAADRLQQALGPGSTLADRQIAVDAVKLSRNRGAKAREEARLAAEQTMLARSRSLVAEINLIGVRLSSRPPETSSNLIAYYTQSSAETVRSVQEEYRLGLGETALVLAAAKSSQRPVETLISAAGEDLDVVEAAHTSGARLRYVNLFLRFIADALAKEAGIS